MLLSIERMIYSPCFLLLRKSMEKHLTIDTIDILDCNGGDHGYAFATNFNPEINLREVSAPGLSLIHILIIVDSSDPFGPSEGLFTREFYGSCFNALKEDGIMVNQQGSPFYAERCV